MEIVLTANPPQRTVRAPYNAYGSPKLSILLYSLIYLPFYKFNTSKIIN